MKVEQNRDFKPITITLETELEARVIRTLMGVVAGGGVIGDTSFKLFKMLGNLGIESFKEHSGQNVKVSVKSFDLES